MHKNLLWPQGKDKMPELKTKSSTSSFGGSYSVMPANSTIPIETLAGAFSIVMAGVSSWVGRDIFWWNAAISGLGGIFGAFCFLRKAQLVLEHQKTSAIMIGAGLASLFGPIVANAASYYLPWVGHASYFVDAGMGCLVGLLSTPLLGMLRNPEEALQILSRFVPWWRPKDK
jgi:hypothetical protein